MFVLGRTYWRDRGSFSKRHDLRSNRARRRLILFVAALLLFLGSWRMAKAADGDLDQTLVTAGNWSRTLTTALTG